MGYIKHHAIIISSWDKCKIHEAHGQACRIFEGKQVTNYVESPINNLWTFLISPDNSSEYWSESENGDKKRFEFICWLENHCYIDGSSSIRWVELSYADEKGDPKIINWH